MPLIHVLSSNLWSGVERYALDLCRHYKDSGRDVCAVTRDARAVDDIFRENGIRLHFAPLGSFYSFAAVKALSRIIKEKGDGKGTTVVHCHDTRDAFVALMARKMARRPDVKVILTRHLVKRAGHSPIRMYVYRNVDALIFVSRLAKDRFVSRWRKTGMVPVEERKMVILHNSLNIPLEEVTPEPAKGPVTAMYHGRLAPGKGLECLIDAMAILKGEKLRLRLVGSGPPDFVDRLRQRAITAGVMSRIDWPRHRENPSDYIRLCHFGVLPSTVPEAFGLANIEYMAEGRAQICTRNGAQPEYITDGREGILVAPRDAEALASQMKRLLRSPKLRKQIGEAARARFGRELAWTRFIARMDEIYGDI